MLLFWCWISGFVGLLLLLFSMFYSRARYKRLLGFESEYSKKGRNLFFILLILLVADTVLFDRLLERKGIYNFLSFIAGLIGIVSVGFSIVVLIDAIGKPYKEISSHLRK